MRWGSEGEGKNAHLLEPFSPLLQCEQAAPLLRREVMTSVEFKPGKETSLRRQRHRVGGGAGGRCVGSEKRVEEREDGGVGDSVDGGDMKA